MSTQSEIPSNLRSTFQTRTAADISGELSRRNSTFRSDQAEGATFSGGVAAPWHTFLTRRNGHSHDIEAGESTPLLRERAPSARRSRNSVSSGSQPVSKSNDGGNKKAKPGSMPRPVGGHEKLSTFSGVFVPTCLNVLSILMFIRFGLVLGQAGVIGTMGMLVASYAIDLITIFSLSAIASNGTVRGGGAYYLISRSLGPEFGGSIGLVFYLGLVFNTSLNAVGLIDAIQNNFGAVSGNWANALPESLGYNYLWSTVVLMLCTTICLGGSAVFARASNGLLVILLVATFSIPLSGLFKEPFEDLKLGVRFTGLSLTTFKENLWPHFTKGAAGSQLKGKENFQDLFGILFPATSGIFAGASMSGDLKTPSKSIPKGTLWALLLTFVSYTLVIFAMAASTTRPSFIADLNIIQDTALSGPLILAGEFATTFFSTLMGVIGASKLLQALARDELFPGLRIFGQGTKHADEPIYAIFATYTVAQAIMLFDINQIASFITMTYLMTFLVMNLATFLLKIGSAPNFRPSFHFFTWQTALGGALASGTAMFFVDGLYASACVAILLILFLLVHYTSRPRSWGDVSQSLIYHQVRKYLLRLKPEHVKFWRPQILLFVNDPRRQYKLIQFCNSMKKGSLYILGHVIVSNDFGSAVPEARRQQEAWSKYIDFSKIKAFVNIAVSPGFEWGARNLALSAGLGGMRPNIAVLGFYNMDDLLKSQSRDQAGGSPQEQREEEAMADSAQTLTNSTADNKKIERIDSNGKGRKGEIPTLRADSTLPTDSCKTESSTSVTSYVTILEDLLLRLQINVAIARGFQSLEIPSPEGGNKKKSIDLWPIQMSAEIAASGAGGTKANLLTTNFDTYTLILQLGCILHTVPSWRTSYKLRVCVFVEYESDVEDERHRVEALLENLRIEAKILVFWLASGNLPAYEVVVNGRRDNDTEVEEVEQCLRGQDWWEEIQRIRGNRGDPSPGEELDKNLEGVIGAGGVQWPDASFQQGPRHEKVERFLGLRKLLHKNRRRRSLSLDVSGFESLGMRLGMRTQRLPPNLGDDGVESEESGSESEKEDESAASEADMSDFESDSEPLPSPVRITRRRSHGDTLRGPRPSKKSTGERQTTAITNQPTKAGSSGANTPARSLRKEEEGAGRFKSSTAETRQFQSKDESGDDAKLVPPPRLPSRDGLDSPKKLEDRFASLRPPSSNASSRSSLHSPTKTKPAIMSPTKNRVRGLAAPGDERPILSRHASTQKFSSKPVPVTQVRNEEGPGPSIMFVDTPSPPAKGRHRLPSAYHLDGAREEGRMKKAQKEWDAEEKEKEDKTKEAKRPLDSSRNGSRANSPTPSKLSMVSGISGGGSTYSTQSLPLSFNDLPCRAQHLILNQLMRENSRDTAVLFTTLPSPVEGTSLSEEASLSWLNDLEVLGHGLEELGVASMLVHSNSMTVTMSL